MPPSQGRWGSSWPLQVLCMPLLQWARPGQEQEQEGSSRKGLFWPGGKWWALVWALAVLPSAASPSS
jgi:hypothetical protein